MMHVASTAVSWPPSPRQWESRRTGLWTVSSSAMLTLHAGALAFAVWWQPQMQQPEPPPPSAMMIELAPLAAPPAPTNIAAPPPPTNIAAPVEKKAEKLPELQPVKKAEVALPKPEPQPKPAAKMTEETPPLEKTIEPASVPTPAMQPTAAPRAASSAPVVAPVAATASPGTVALSWQGALRAHLERYKRYPSSAMARRQQGISYVRFAMNRDGSVAWARLEQPSGYSRLDDEAMTLMERAQPLPLPPSDVAGQTIEIVVPIEFFLR